MNTWFRLLRVLGDGYSVKKIAIVVTFAYGVHFPASGQRNTVTYNALDLQTLTAMRNEWPQLNWDLADEPRLWDGVNWSEPILVREYNCNGLDCKDYERRVVGLVFGQYMGISGPIPEAVQNLTTLELFHIQGVEVGGAIPSFLGKLTNLRSLMLTTCKFSGAVPEALGDLENLERLDLSYNMLSGQLPNSLQKLVKLTMLGLNLNQFNTTFPVVVTKLPNLTTLGISSSKISGALPESIGDLSLLQSLSLANNDMSGPLPESIGKLKNLKTLELRSNALSGDLPQSIGNLTSLETLSLQSNKFSSLPPSIGNAVNLHTIDISNNELDCVIPETIANLKNLTSLNLGGNKLYGKLPQALTTLKALQKLSLSGNLLDGEIFTSFANMTELTTLQLGNNKFSGPIPKQFNTKLITLSLVENNLTGEIPSSLGSLSSLTTLALSYNQLSGTIPASLAQLKGSISLSNNKLTGEIPPAFKNSPATGFVFYGNKLTGGASNLPMGPLIEIDIRRNVLPFSDLDKLPNLEIRYIFPQDTIGTPVTINVKEGQKLSISALDSCANCTYQWAFENPGGGFRFLVGETRNKLSFSEVKSTDIGSYYCRIGNTRISPNIYTWTRQTVLKGNSVTAYDPSPDFNDYYGALDIRFSKIFDLKPVTKAAADGITKLLLVKPSEVPVTFTIPNYSQGMLGTVNGKVTGVKEVEIAPQAIYDSRGFGPNNYCVVVYTVPSGYGAQQQGYTDAVVLTRSGTELPEELKIKLIPPPVVLVHGMWSSPEVWHEGNFVQALKSAGYTTINLADYSANSVLTFSPGYSESAPGRAAIMRSIKAAIDSCKASGAAVSQVDIVAHSLGGLMTRSLAQDPVFTNQKNFYKGYIHRFITLGTPHLGSPLGPLLWNSSQNAVRLPVKEKSGAFRYVDITVQNLNDLTGKSGGLLTIGSVHRDFDPAIETNYAFRTLKRTENMMVHAIAGSWKPDLSIMHYGWDKILSLIFKRNLNQIFSNDDDHDLMVSVRSQHGGLKDKHTSLFPNTIHMKLGASVSETNNAAIQARVIDLLQTTDTTRFAKAFPSPYSVHANVPDNSRKNGTTESKDTRSSQLISLVEPLSGEIVAGTTELTLEFETLNGAAPEAGLFFVEGLGYFDAPDKPPYRTRVSLKNNPYQGKLFVAAIVRDQSGLLLADTAHIVLTPTLPLRGIRGLPHEIILDSIQREWRIVVEGINYNGTDSLRSRITHDINYSFTKKGVAEVTPDGIIFPLKPGNDMLEITHKGFKDVIAVTVLPSFTNAEKNPLTIEFDELSPIPVDSPPLLLKAETFSNNPVSYEVTGGTARLHGNMLVPLAIGKAIVTATHLGDGYYMPAAPVSQTICITPPTPQITFDEVDATLTSSSAVGNQWYRNNMAVDGATEVNLTVNRPGTYTVKVTINECSATSAPLVTEIVTGIETHTFGRDIQLYPNPNEGVLYLSSENTPISGKLCIFNAVGTAVMSADIHNTSESSFYISHLGSGFYIVKIVLKDGIVNRSFVKR